MNRTLLITGLVLLIAGQLVPRFAFGQATGADAIVVKPSADFELSGDGRHPSWQGAAWQALPERREPANRQDTRFKVLYSKTGIYFLFYCQDQVLTASKTKDFDNLWLEDVVEVFLWPDTTQTIYFEYEISPLNYELPILVPNNKGKFLGWQPWGYEGARRTRHATKVTGGKKASGSTITGWQAEFFIPYALLAPLGNVPPQAGTRWRANMYRLDYDHKKTTAWSWQATDKTFHEFDKFGVLIFE